MTDQITDANSKTTPFPLSEPIKAYGEELHILDVRRPNGKDVRELGYPYQMNPDSSVKLLADVVAKYLVRLANLPPSAVDQMAPPDLNQAGWLVAGFFLGGGPPNKS